MKAVFTVILGLIALFAGGCSLTWIYAVLVADGDNLIFRDPSVYFTMALGLGATAACVWGIRRLSRMPENPRY
jgi:hypothetical protein